MPEVTVVIPTHNRSTLLRTTLRAVLAQRDVELEVVVVDDGSSDGTGDVIASFADARTQHLRHSLPQGVSQARNAGISASTGHWISFCDDDDVWAPDKLSEQIASARRSGRDWAYCGVVNVDVALHPVSAPPTPTADEAVRALPRYNAIPGGGSNVIASRNLLARAGPFDAGLRNIEDWEMWLRLSRLGPPAVAQRRLVAYRLHAGNASLDVPEVLRGVRRIERLHDVTVDRGRIHRWLAESCLRRGRRFPAIQHWVLAAARGQLLPVVADASRVLTRRVKAPHLLRARDIDGPAWAVDAREWLDPLHPAEKSR